MDVSSNDQAGFCALELPDLPSVLDKTQLGFCSHLDRVQVELNVVPKEVYDLLLTKSGQQECKKESVLTIRAGGEKCIQFCIAVFTREGRYSFRHINVPRDSATPILFQELSNDGHVVDYGIVVVLVVPL